jgi:phospholipase C
MIDHIFVLMLENRSFDHMLGSSKIQGADAVDGRSTKIEGLAGTEENQSPHGGTIRVGGPAEFAIKADPGHEFIDVREQLCGKGGSYSSPTPSTGSIDPNINNSGFVSSYAGKYPTADWATVMNCFTPTQMPILTALATDFAVCDHWFSSMPGPTWPNRFFVHAATSGGLDHSPSLPKDLVSQAGDPYGFANGTVFDLLDAAKVDWAVYNGDEFPQSLHMKGMSEFLNKGRFRGFRKFTKDLQEGPFTKSYVFIEPDWHPFTHFTCGNSQHPVDDVTRGELLLKNVYEAIRNSPIWEKSVLIITYDEHGGFFDHIPPPTVVSPGDPTPNPTNNKNGFNFQQLGVRVPAVVVSPLVKRGTIDHRVYEHASIPATIERRFGLTNLTERDKHASSVESLLTLKNPRTDAPKTLPNPAVSGISCSPEAKLITRLGWVFGEFLILLGLRTPRTVDLSLAGFVHVALQRELLGSTKDARDSIVRKAKGINTEADALRYIRRVRRMTRVMTELEDELRRL